MQQLTLLAFAFAILQISQMLAFGFEFDDLKSTNFAPGGAGNQYSAVNFAEDEDNAGFTPSRGSVGGASGGVSGTRRLIQPPPLKRSFSSFEAAPNNAKWLLFHRPSLNYYYLTRI